MLRLVLTLIVIIAPLLHAAETSPFLAPSSFAAHVARFNAMEDENVTNFISNARSFDWLAANIPRFECPDREVEEIYYFRWWLFRKHLKQTANGFVFTEFLVPMKHAGAHNTLSCAAGHHLAEGRWLRDARYLDDYTRFWLRGHDGGPQPHFHKFSSWFAAAVWDRYLVNGDASLVTNLLDDLVADYRIWERERRLPDGLFWQYDVDDGMEESISGSRTAKQARPTINSYMFANARAIANIARLAGRGETAQEFDANAAELKRLTQEKLWNPADNFFEVRREAVASVAQTSQSAVSQVSKPASASPTKERRNAERPADLEIGDTAGLDTGATFANVREAIGFIPWAFSLPDAQRGYASAWAQFTDPAGFRAPYGLTTAERRHPQFRTHGCCQCEWDGAVWPFATSQTLGALANVLRDYASEPLPVSARDYFNAFLTYTRSHRFNGQPYLGEYLDETTGAWLKGRQERSRYYNHSTFADLLITGVIGLRPRPDDRVEIHPLLPAQTWDWFCLDDVKYHEHMLTILWDQDGSRYRRGAGFVVLADGREIAKSDRLERITGRLP